jgi:hypothetical protein
MILDTVATPMTLHTSSVPIALESTQQFSTPSGPYPDYSHIELSYILPYNAHLHDQQAVLNLLERYRSYPQHILDGILFIIVDEGHGDALSLREEHHFNLLYLRITNPVEWNEGGAKNIGVMAAKSEKILLGDFDHYFQENTLNRIISKKLPGHTLYRFMRAEPHTQRKSSNVIYLSRTTYLSLYGFDEDFSGHYGYGDVFFLKWAAAHGMLLVDYPGEHPAVHLHNPRIEGMSEADRDLHRNGLLYKKKMIDLRHYGARGGHTRRHCAFSWITLGHYLRANKHGYKKADSLWIKAQWLRYLKNLLRR